MQRTVQKKWCCWAMARTGLQTYIKVCLLLFLAGWATIWSLAEFIAIGPRAAMDAAWVKQQLPKTTDWRPAYRPLELASKIKSADANMLFDLGRLSWWISQYKGVSKEEKAAWLQISIEHLEAAVRSRPTFGRAWIEMANVRLQNQDYLQARKDFAIGIRLARYEGKSLSMALWTGFSLWILLSGDERDQLMDAARFVIERGEPTWSAWVVDAAYQNGQLKQIEGLITPSSAAEQRLKYWLNQR